jgi:DNA polymerase III subunit delta'
MGFDEFLGNAPVVEALRKQLVQDRLPHTLLFGGMRGIGKRTLADFLSMAVNCTKLRGDFCRQCPSCRKILDSSHGDVKHFAPEGQFIKIDSMRELSREVFFRPFEGRMRVFIIDEAEKMNLESANSILKTLEEPPSSSLLILTSNQPNEMLPTILSRCQIYRFSPLPRDTILHLLEKRGGGSREEQLLLARISGGSIGRALCLQLDEYRRTRQDLLELVQLCSRDFLYSRVTRILAPLSKEKQEFGDKMSILYGLLHDLFLLKVDPASELITNLDIRETLVSLSTVFSVGRIVAGTKTLDRLEIGARRNLNKQLCLDQFVFCLGGQVMPQESWNTR